MNELKKGSIVIVKINDEWEIKIIKVLKGYAKGTIIKTGQYCDFTLDKIIKVISY